MQWIDTQFSSKFYLKVKQKATVMLVAHNISGDYSFHYIMRELPANSTVYNWYKLTAVKSFGAADSNKLW